MIQQKILIVDDNQVIIKTLSMKLTSAGYQVVSALDGSEAIAAARKEKPDLVLLDINFPSDLGVDWDGFKLIAWLKRMDEAASTPIIVISGGEAAKFKERALQAGAVAYFQKPIEHATLIESIKKTLDENPNKPAQA